MKRWIYYFSCLVCANSALGADIQGGETFADGQSVTAARMNNHVNAATILPAFISNKTSSAPVSADSFIFYQAGSTSLQRATLGALQTALLSNTPLTGTTDVQQYFDLSGVLSPAQITTDQNDYNPTNLATANVLRLNSDATRNVTGLSGGGTGRILIVYNVGSFPIILNNQNASSSAVNRFAFYTGFDDIIMPDGARLLQYDNTSQRWRCISKHYNINPAYVALTDAATIAWSVDPTKAVQNNTLTIAGNRQLGVPSGLANGMTGVIEVLQDATGSRKLALPGPNFTDGVGNGTTTFTSATATFVSGDVGGQLVEPGAAHVTFGTTIASVTNGTTVVLSATATSGTTLTFYLPRRQSRVLGGGAGAVTLTTAASATDVLTWIYDGAKFTWAISKNAN